MRSSFDRDDEEDEEVDRHFRQEDPARGRGYFHEDCGGQTIVSGGDFTHICDPFWPCTGTFCCGCNNFAPLHRVVWIDTGEKVSEFRRRMRAETPGILKAWRFGLGLLPGAVVGGGIGALVVKLARLPADRLAMGLGIGALVGGLLAYFVGTLILNRIFGIDYRRRR